MSVTEGEETRPITVGQQARALLPQLFFPLLWTKILCWGVERGPVALSLRWGNRGTARAFENPEIALLLGLALVCQAVSALLFLGGCRLCLDRASGKRGQMPWRILREWKRYKSWWLWMGIVPILWHTGKRVAVQLAVEAMDYREVDTFFLRRNYYNFVMTIASLLLLMLLALAVRTRYLQHPEEGFLRAVWIGVPQGLKKWPKMVGEQLKYVASVNMAAGTFNILWARLTFGAGSGLISMLCNGFGLLVSWVSGIWIWAVYGCMGAKWFGDGPEVPTEQERM